MAFDGFITKAVTAELNNCLIGGKVLKVYQPNKDEIILNVYANSKHYNLDVCIHSSNCRIHLTSEKKANPITPPSFCMLLRKHLVGSKIRKIESIGLDRIIIFHLETYNELNDLIYKKLVIELMGKHSNIILLNEKDMIIDAARHISSGRTILPANPYYFLSSDKKNISDVSFEEFNKMIKADVNNFVNILSSCFYGFSKSFIYYVVFKLNINLEKLTSDDVLHFYEYVTTLLSNIQNSKVDCSNFEFNNKLDYVLISSENASDLKINTFLDSYYSSKEKNEYFENYRNNILRLILSHLKKYQKRLTNIDKKLEECKQMDEYKLYGELITANLYKINNNYNIDHICLENYYDNNKPINISLDKKYSPAVNAKIFFKKYNKLKNALEIVSRQKEDTKKELTYIESIIYSIHSATTVNELDDIYLEIQETILNKKIVDKKTMKTKKENSSPISLEMDGYTIYVGRNNKQNDTLTFKIASKNDIWFHAKDIHGSHVVLCLNNQNDPSEKIIYKCASIAAFYSKAKDSSKVEVQYTQIKNIKKPKNSKPGFVIFNQYKSIIVEPKELEEL